MDSKDITSFNRFLDGEDGYSRITRVNDNDN